MPASNNNKGNGSTYIEPKKEGYDAGDIKVLKGLAGVRKRPSMYIGDQSKKGLHHLVFEVLDNSVDEALAGFADHIRITFYKDNSVEICDNGRGIPIDIHPEFNKPAVEVIMEHLHSGGKFDNKSYKISGGLHGIGLSVVNALTEYLIVEINRDGIHYKQKFSKGVKVTEPEIIETGKTNSGTAILFYPDAEIFDFNPEERIFNYHTIAARIRELAFLTPQAKFEIQDKINDDEEEFYYEGGIKEFIAYLNKDKQPLHNDIISISDSYDSNGSKVYVDIAMQYNQGYQNIILSYANTINTIEGGTHLTGFKSALTRTMNSYIEKNMEKKYKEHVLSGSDTREGLSVIISVKLPEPQFESQTKIKLGNPEIRQIVSQAITEYLAKYLEENPQNAKKIILKTISAKNAREAAQKAKLLIRRKSALDNARMPGKLADCSSNKPEECEVFIVEGDSAGGCLSGETKVALTDGRNLSFLELVEEEKKGKENFCYTILSDGGIGIEKILNPRRTKTNVKVIKITLDSDDEIICTPEHLFLLRDGIYKQAQYLQKTDSLMPLVKELSKKEHRITIEGYEMVLNFSTHKWEFTHVLADDCNLKNNKYSLEDGEVRHHFDFNKLNNNPTNILRVSKEEHLKIHRENVLKTIQRPDVIEKCRKIKRSADYRKMMSEIMKEMHDLLSQRAKKQWENDEYKQYMIKSWKAFYNSNRKYRLENNRRLKEESKKYWASEENRKKQSERVKKYFKDNPEMKKHLSMKGKEQWQDKNLLQWRSEKTKAQWTPEFREKRRIAYNKTYFKSTITLMKEIFDKEGNLDRFNDIRKSVLKNRNILLLETFVNRFFEGNYSNAIEAVKNYNHKIKSIEVLEHSIEVFDIEVPNTHNFALTSGVFVHNSAKQGRDRTYQAILPLRGKILNVEKARLDKILQNNEILSIIRALGVGIQGVSDEEFSLEKLRYHRVIIMCDADIDGHHIETLLLTFFFRYMRPLIDEGHLYMAVPPLYELKYKKSREYVYTDKEKEEKTEELIQKYKLKNADSIKIKRFKGLGEMNPEELYDTTMNKTTRALKKMIYEDYLENDLIFTKLMGKEVKPRKKFIIEHYNEVSFY